MILTDKETIIINSDWLIFLLSSNHEILCMRRIAHMAMVVTPLPSSKYTCYIDHNVERCHKPILLDAVSQKSTILTFFGCTTFWFSSHCTSNIYNKQTVPKLKCFQVSLYFWYVTITNSKPIMTSTGTSKGGCYLLFCFQFILIGLL